MSRLVSALTTVVFAIVITGCATSTPKAVSSEALPNIKRVGVVSVAAQVFNRQHVGLTMFGNETEKLDISAWGLDAKYGQQLSRELSDVGGYEVVNGAYSSADFLHINDLNGPWEAPAFTGPNWGAIEKPIKSYCAQHQVGAIVMAYALTSHDFLARTNQSIRGAGMYTRGGLVGDILMSYLHLMSGVALVDCKTAKPFAVRTLASSQDASGSSMVRSYPLKQIPSELSRTHLDQLTPTQIAALQDMLTELPKNAWKATVRSLFGK